MSDPRIALRKELKKLTDEQLLKRYCKHAGRLFSDERWNWTRLLTNGMFENTSSATGDRGILVDMIVRYEVPGG